ncbi:MAG: formate dehydrogenase [Vitreoscilla sp.]|nr:formate dehydrogenase [Vitreoscilla sp.]
MSKTPSSETGPRLSRRLVFAGAGTAGALAAAAVLLPKAPEVPAPDTAAAPPAAGDQGRYQVTPHVLRYYQTAKV